VLSIEKDQPKTQVPKANPGHPPCDFGFRAAENFRVPSME
jgi:hypothetical protein